MHDLSPGRCRSVEDCADPPPRRRDRARGGHRYQPCRDGGATAAEERGITYVSPYNDPRIIAGQGTIGKEILEDGAAPDAVVVSVGGGGLISGIATWIKASSPSTLVIGASAANDRAMAASIDAGEIITPHFEPTFSDGTAGGLEDDTVTFDICRALVDRWVDISELEIARAVASMVDDHHHLVEGLPGGACGSHTLRRYEPRYSGCRRQLWCQRRCNVARGDVGDGQPLGQRQPDPGCATPNTKVAAP